MKVCGVSDQWTDGPGTEEKVLIELKVGTQVSGICPLTIKMACLQCVDLVSICSRCVSPDN